MFPKKIRILLIALLSALSVFLILERTLFPGLSFKSQEQEEFKILGRAINLIRSQYVEEPEAGRTLEGAYKGIVDSLDVLSSYLDPASMEKYLQRKSAADWTDIGLILYKRYGSFAQVIGMDDDSPALEKGIQNGDVITGIDGRSTLLMTMREANLLLMSQKADPITMTVMRALKNEDVVIPRRALSHSRTDRLLVHPDFLRIRIDSLSPDVVNQIRREIPARAASGKAVILDLRNCTEGEFSEAARLIRLFLKEVEMGYFVNKLGPVESLQAEGNPLSISLPLYIWINHATCGAAEAAAGVLQEYKKAVLIGLPTPGLAGRTRNYQFEDGSGLILTADVFHLPSGKKVWEEGLEPDYSVSIRKQSTQDYLDQTEKARKQS